MEPTELAGCIILDDYDRMLLLHRYSSGTPRWELPGGKVEEGELPEMAAVRELYEELGVRVRLVKALGSEVFEDENGEFRYHWFLADIIGGEPALQEQDTFDDFDYIEFDDLPALSLSANMMVLYEKLIAGELRL